MLVWTRDNCMQINFQAIDTKQGIFTGDGLRNLVSSKFFEKPPFSSMDNSKRINDFTEKYSVFEVNYDGVLFELPLSFVDYHEDIKFKLKSHEKLKMDAASMTIDELVSWEKEEARSPYLRTPPLKSSRKSIEFQGKNLYADFLHADCVDDHFDALDYWNYEDVYFSGCFDVGGSSTGCDWIDERVGYTDRSLPDISKAEFSKEALLNDGGSSSATSLSFVLKRKGKSRVKFTRKRAILKRSKMLSLRKGVRSHNVKAGVAKIDAGRLNYGSLVSFIGLNEDVCDDEPQLATQLSQTGGSSNNDFKDVD
ncbi:hypothetical protein Tco_0132658 [Tanacetum coccineum]